MDKKDTCKKGIRQLQYTLLNTKNVMLEYLKVIEDKLIDMFCTPATIRQISNAKYKRYANDKLTNKLNT